MHKILITRKLSGESWCRVFTQSTTGEYIHCYDLEKDEEFIAQYKMGAWKEVSLIDIVRKLNND